MRRRWLMIVLGILAALVLAMAFWGWYSARYLVRDKGGMVNPDYLEEDQTPPDPNTSK